MCIAFSLSCQLKLIVCRSLEDIERRSQVLLGKRKAARILDKTQDSQAIIKLVEDLRQAIFIYQVGTIRNHGDHAGLTSSRQLSQQQSIDSQIAQLAVSSLFLSSPLELMGGLSNEVFF